MMGKDVKKWLKENNKTVKQLKRTFNMLLELNHPIIVSLNKIGVTYKNLSLSLVKQLWSALDNLIEHQQRESEIEEFDKYMLEIRGV